jgi:hypothetical protein
MPDSPRTFISKTNPIEEEPAEWIAQRIEVPKGIGLNANLNQGTPKIFMQMPPRFDDCLNFGDIYR